MITSKADINNLPGLELTLNPLGHRLQLANSNNTRLRCQNERVGHNPPNGANITNANSASIQLSGGKFPTNRQISQPLYLLLNLNEGEGLDVFYVGHH